MGKRKFTEAERQRRVEYQRAYRAQKSADPACRKRESQHKKVNIFFSCIRILLLPKHVMLGSDVVLI
jgi:hypothetical protein